MAQLRRAIVGAVTAGLLMVAPSAASALTLGSTTSPSGATAGTCTAGAFYAQGSSNPSVPYSVPAGGGSVLSWSVNTTGATPGASVSLVVLRPGATFTVVGFDTESLPNPLPASNVATFHIASPIAVQAGDVLALYASASSGICYFSGGTIPASATVPAGLDPSPTVGATYTPVTTFPTSMVNVSAELAQTEDAGVSGSATPAAITAGGAAEYLLSVSNAGLASGTISLTDVLPSGLSVLSAVSGEGSCTVAGPVVKCSMFGAIGAKVPVAIAVLAPKVGTFTNTATVSATLTDPNPANNVATSTLTVVPPSCKLVKLTGKSPTLAKQIISALGCKVGKVTKKSSKSVHKGLVISTTPGTGASVPAGTAVGIVVSSGPPPKKHGKSKKH